MLRVREVGGKQMRREREKKGGIDEKRERRGELMRK